MPDMNFGTQGRNVCMGFCSVATPIFRVKRASNSQDTVDYIVQRAARKNSWGNPGLRTTCVIRPPLY